MDIDVSKENIQPLRGGRNLVQLGTALQAQSDSDAQRQLQLQKEQHEEAIRQYAGPDPLDPWFSYIQWLEQCYPKHGHEGHMDKLIKDCLQHFEKDERYYQDRRFVKLWIKYIDCLANPLEIYQRLHATGIGVQCAEFYRAWACYCEESGDYKKANQVYMLGMQARAQPFDELEQAHMNFQLFFAQRMLHDDSPTKRKAACALAETRMALTSLRSFKRRNVAAAPVQRVGDSVRSLVPGTVRQGNVERPNNNIMLNVYEDAPSTSDAAPSSSSPHPAGSLMPADSENARETGVWTLPKTQMVRAHIVPPQHQPLPFTPYEDSDDVLRLSSKHLPHCVDDLTFNVALCVPDPPDPTKISCYNKTQVYVDDKEHSLEEIRARKYLVDKTKRESPQNHIQDAHGYSEHLNETLAQCSALETLANCALDPEQDHLQLHLNVPAIQNITKVTNMHSPGEPKLIQNLDSKEFQLSAKKDDSIKSQGDKENLANGVNNENCPPAYGKHNLMEEFNKSLMGNLLSDSVTVNTKEARWELRNIFNDNEPSLVAPEVVVPPVSLQQFAIHCDRSITVTAQQRQQHQQQDKENDKAGAVSAALQPQPASNKTTYEEEPCTQVFNLNVRVASTPNSAPFKRPRDHTTNTRYSIDDTQMEQGESAPRREQSRPAADQPSANENHLSVIMEATREYNSKSGSSSSGASTRANFTGYSGNYDVTYNHPGGQELAANRRASASQPRLANGQFARASLPVGGTAAKRDDKAPYLAHDHQYQKPVTPQNYNGYSPQPQPQPQQQFAAGYGYQQYSYTAAPYSPQHQPQPFHSPPYAQPQPYQQPHVYATQDFNSPQPHQQYYQRQHPQQYNQTYQMHNYNANMYANSPNQSQAVANQSYVQSPYRAKVDSNQYGQPFQVYQSPQHASAAYRPEETAAADTANKSAVIPHNSPTATLRTVRHDQPQTQPQPLKQSQPQPLKQSPAAGFTNQFLNFISNRNEPADTANTPKFTNSPNISLKMHRNLYVSSPEQAQGAPSSGHSDTDSKDGLTAHTLTPVRSAHTNAHTDASKRQLEFEPMSEDSRDSNSKSVPSRHSALDADSESSTECGAFRSTQTTHSISLVETSDIRRPADIPFPSQIDPFSKQLLASLLQYVQFPNRTHAEGYVSVRNVPKLQVGTAVGVANSRYAVEKQLGKGNYGAVFLCLDLQTNKPVAVKYQKPSRPWEFYICQEIKARIKDPFMLPGYMDITTAFLGENASLFVSEYCRYGSLLDVANRVRVATSKCISEPIVLLLASEMLAIVHHLHKAQIIHADIKPDNFLLMQIPTQEWRTPSLQLIDLGCAIDMSLFPPHTTFRELISTEGFTCSEMRGGQPWTYQTDLYCLAGTVHVVLLGCYMKVVTRHGHWHIDKKLPRYMKVNLWDKLFSALLNVPDCDTLPDLVALKDDVDAQLRQLDNLGAQLRTFDNVLNAR